MPNKKHVVDLTAAGRNESQALAKKGTLRARKMKRAQILLKADAGLMDGESMPALSVSRLCVDRVRQRSVEGDCPKP